MLHSYKLAIIYFIVFSTLLLVSAFMLFIQKIGFAPDAILAYYQGDEEKFIQAKTLAGLLKVVYPHLLSIGLFTMVLLHFVYFTSFKKSTFFVKFIYLSYVTVFVEIFSGFALILGSSVFAYIKLLSFLLMFVLFIFMFFILLRSILTQKNPRV